MIILPVEKRLKWNRAPYILFSIVFINIAIFFFYQMNDSKKMIDGVTIYVKEDLQELEVPLYLDYLELPENKEQKKDLDRLYNEKYEQHPNNEVYEEFYEKMGYDPKETEEFMRKEAYKELAVPLILQDSKFYNYLESKPQLFESTAEYDSWKENRRKVNEFIEKASSAQFALVPNEQKWYTFITHQFMHGDIMHLAGNMFFLIMCGFAVEAAIGHFRFLLFYLISGAVGGFAHAFFNANSVIPLVGASGAISGVMAMYMGIFRFRKIEFFYWFYVIVGYLKAPALLILALYIAKEAVSYYFFEDGVAYMAHLGGFVAGFLLILAVLVFKRDFLDDEYVETDDAIEPEQIQQAEIKNALEKLHFKKALELVNNAVTTGSSEDKYHRDNVMLNAKLLFLVNEEQADESVVKLMANNKPKMNELDDYLALWKKVKNKARMPAESVLQLGISFMDLEDKKVSENIFLYLAKQKFKNAQMSVLAGRLAYHYDQEQQADKAEYYLKLSQAFK